MHLAFSDFGFGKSLRLLNSPEFQTVFDAVEWKVSTQHILLLTRSNSLGKPRLGLVIAKRHVKKAVQRNRIKRLIRESFRLNQSKLAGVDIVVLIRPGVDMQDNAALLKQLDGLWRRLNKKRAHTVPTP
jgi:ribonuclease P protein component